MLKFVSAAAVLLLSFTPAFAANLPQDDKGQIAVPGTAQTEENKTTQAPEQTADDDIQIIIMGHGTQIQVPNPYANPGPRMITDAWAMRA